MTNVSLVRVLIATTEGPIEIRSIEGAALRSFAVSSPDKMTPIKGFSEAYHRFVARPKGIIGAVYGQDFFRLEVSRPIDAGESWQLGVFIAHALHAAGRLARPSDQAGAVVLATGAIDPCNLSLRAVGAVERKLTKAMPRFEAEARAGTATIAIWPASNHEDASARIDALHGHNVKVAEVESVGEALETLGLALPDGAIVRTRPVWEGSPFRGLEPFDPAHRAIFFGRGRAREEALERLVRAAHSDCAFLLVHGASGAGKSSLARAALLGDIAQLTSEADKWLTTIVVPGRGGVPPAQALAEGLVEAIPEFELRAEALADAMIAQPAGAAAAVTTALAGGRGTTRLKLVLLIDQIEQLMLWARAERSSAAARERDAVADMLARLARSGVVWVVATMRSDLQSLLEDSPALSRLAANGAEYRLERPTPAEFREIVLRPVDLAGMALEGEDASGLPFAHVLVEAAAKAPDSLPLLEFALARLYEADGRGGKLRYDTYAREIGGLEGAIARRAHETTAALGSDPEIIQAVDDVLLRLGRLDRDTGQIVAAVVPLDGGFSTPAREQVIAALADARLVVRDVAHGQQTARVAHEALLTHWPRAQQLFVTSRAKIDLRDRLEDEAKSWKDDGDLIRDGRRLADAKALLAEGRPELSPTARAYVQSSADNIDAKAMAERKRALKTLRAAVAAACAFFALAAATVVLYWQADALRIEAVLQRDAAGEAQGRFLLARSKQAEQSGDNVTASLYALRALEADQRWKEQNFERGCAEDAATVQHDDAKPIRAGAKTAGCARGANEITSYVMSSLQILEQGGGSERAVLRTDGVVTSDPNIVHNDPYAPSDTDRPRTDATLLQQWADAQRPEHLDYAAFSPDQSLILTRSRNGLTIRIWDAARYRLLHEINFRTPARIVFFSPLSGDDRLFATVGDRVEIWNARTGQRSDSIPQAARINAMAASSDGNWLAVASTNAVALDQHFDGQRWQTDAPPDPYDGSVMAFEMKGGSLLSVTVPEKAPVLAVAFDPTAGSRKIITVSLDEAHLWNLDHLDQPPLVLPHVGLAAAAYSPDGRWILTQSADVSVKLWDARSGRLEASHDGARGDKQPNGALQGKGVEQCKLPLATIDGEVRIDAHGSLAQAWCATARSSFDQSHAGTVRRILLDPTIRPTVGNGCLAAAPLSADFDTRIVRGLTETFGEPSICETLRAWPGSIFFPRGASRVIVGGAIFSIPGLQAVHPDWSAFALSSDARAALTHAKNDYDNLHVRRIDGADSDPGSVLAGHVALIDSAQLSPDDRLILTVSLDGTARVWDVPDPERKPNISALFINANDIVARLERAKAGLPRCVTLAQMQDLYLDPKPPAWCIEMGKWPYETEKWRRWLADERAGNKPPLPSR